MRAAARLYAALIVAALPCAMAPQAAATMIVAENFNRTNGTNMDGATPDVANLPGGNFSSSQPAWTTQALGNQLQFGADVALNAPLGGYFTGSLHLSADISLGNLAGTSSTPHRGVGLVFSTIAAGQWNFFTGLRLAPDGNLQLEHFGINEATISLSGIAANTFYALSYDVNVGTGALSNILISGVSANYSSIVTASQSQNYFAGANNLSVFAGGSAGGQFGYLDNLSVSNSQTTAVPEPVPLGMLALGLGAIGIVRSRRSLSRRRSGPNR